MPTACEIHALAPTTPMRSQNPKESRAFRGIAKTRNATGNAAARAHLGPPAKAAAPQVKRSRPMIDTLACSATNPSTWRARPPSIAPTASAAPAPAEPSCAVDLRFRATSQKLIPRIRKPCWVSEPGLTHWKPHQ